MITDDVPDLLLPMVIVLVANSTPIVDLMSKLNWSQANLNNYESSVAFKFCDFYLDNRHDFPTPESPTRTILNR